MDRTFSKKLGPIFHDNRNLKIWNMATGDTFFMDYPKQQQVKVIDVERQNWS
jgi:hypothetical protein